VSVVGSHIYTMGDLGDTSYVFALNLKDGAQVWKAKVSSVKHVDYPGTRGTPSVDGNLVYAIGQFGDLVCVKVADGSEVWRKSFTSDFKGGQPHWGFAESPLVDGGLVICTPGGREGTLVALDKATGDVKWRTADIPDSAAYSS